jgi:hypothetical protein
MLLGVGVARIFSMIFSAFAMVNETWQTEIVTETQLQNKNEPYRKTPRTQSIGLWGRVTKREMSA